MNLEADIEFIDEMIAETRAAGILREPRFDAATCRLVEAELQIDLLNVWHTTRQRQHPETSVIVGNWIRPKHLGHACYFGRVDVVQKSIEGGLPLDGSDYGGDPIAAAMEAWVVTTLHVRCVELLFEAGAAATLAQFDAISAESVGSECDRALTTLLVTHASRSPDPSVRARAKEWSPA
jgi:hypothetical protein